MKITIEVEHQIGDIVFLKTDVDQYKRIVIGYWISSNGVTYRLSINGNEDNHFDVEISKHKDYSLN